MAHIQVTVTESPIQYKDIFAQFDERSHGAIVSFFGIVRDLNDGKRVTGITYDIHKPLAERELCKICDEASSFSQEDTRICLIHRSGKIAVGEIAVAIAVSSPHRNTAFAVCRYIIEELKKRVPIWKEELYENGKSEWLKGHRLLEKHDEKATG